MAYVLSGRRGNAGMPGASVHGIGRKFHLCGNLRRSIRLCGSSGYLFADQFTDDLSGTFVVGLSFSPDVVHSQIVQSQEAGVPAAYEAGTVGAHFGYVGGIVFIQRIRFFFGQFRHNFLLSFEQRDQCGPALHGMKHLHRILINNIIQNFKRIGITVKTDEQVFSRVSFFKYSVILRDFERPPYIGFAHIMFESRLPEHDSNVHYFHYTMPHVKPQCPGGNAKGNVIYFLTATISLKSYNLEEATNRQVEEVKEVRKDVALRISFFDLAFKNSSIEPLSKTSVLKAQGCQSFRENLPAGAVYIKPAGGSARSAELGSFTVGG
jgi:hypothetical protein